MSISKTPNTNRIAELTSRFNEFKKAHWYFKKSELKKILNIFGYKILICKKDEK